MVSTEIDVRDALFNHTVLTNWARFTKPSQRLFHDGVNVVIQTHHFSIGDPFFCSSRALEREIEGDGSHRGIFSLSFGLNFGLSLDVQYTDGFFNQNEVLQFQEQLFFLAVPGGKLETEGIGKDQQFNDRFSVQFSVQVFSVFVNRFNFVCDDGQQNILVHLFFVRWMDISLQYGLWCCVG